MLKTKVILSRVTNLSDARYAAGMGVNYIGFSINPESAEYVTIEQAKTISDWLSGVSMIGDIGDSITNDVEEYGLDYLQINNTSLIDDIDEPILTLKINTGNEHKVFEAISQYSSKVLYFILSVNADLITPLQPRLKDLCDKYTIYISTEFNDQNLANILSDIKPAGIVLFGSNEVKPGLSSYDGIADILEQLEEG